jgi:N-acetyl-anhydromuramyl-L-alanine amidase AmpD
MKSIKAFNRLIVHHSASPLSTTVEDIRRWHVDERGWSDVGYHLVVLSNGTIETGRPLPKRGAHAHGSNSDSIGVCLVGNNLERDQMWTHLQVDSLHRIWGACEILFPGIELYGHRDVPGAATSCPGLDVYELIYGTKRGE